MTGKQFTRDEIMEIIDESFFSYYERYHHNMTRIEYLFLNDIQNWIEKNVLHILLELEKEMKE